ncbi:hypothetical protein GIB67_000191 [Kingdonia uniflora]|uniref:Uncharacterized protein n=1 Tax=Kingdonia uniflora TaxID=39325 RepID=A0A7J7P9J3_9MAGN|nr:hypothetical protein GIB67_000191 [Kingdonia uniflora]
MDRVVGNIKLANQVVTIKNVEKELSAENTEQNTTLNRYNLEAKKVKEATLLEAKKA